MRTAGVVVVGDVGTEGSSAIPCVVEPVMRREGSGPAGMLRSRVSTRRCPEASYIRICPEWPSVGALENVRTRWVSGLTATALVAGNLVTAVVCACAHLAHKIAKAATAGTK